MFFRKKHRIPFGTENFLSVLEGIEGGFAIFTGIVVGLSFEILDRRVLLVAAVVGILVNAFNSSAVRYSSEHYMDELDGREKRDVWRSYGLPAFSEFIAYAIVSAIVVLPLIFIPSLQWALVSCIILTLIVLFTAGYYKGMLLRANPTRDGMELATLGFLIIVVGATAGYTLSSI